MEAEADPEAVNAEEEFRSVMLALRILPNQAAFAQAVDDHNDDTSFPSTNQSDQLPPGSQGASQQDRPQIMPDSGSAESKKFEKRLKRVLVYLRRFKKDMPHVWKAILEEFIKKNSEV